MHTPRISHSHRLNTHRHSHDVEYVVRAHHNSTGWTLVVDPVRLDIDRDGTVRAANIVDTLAVTTSLPHRSWNAAAADDALRAIGFERAEPWDIRSTSGLTAWTQAVTFPVQTGRALKAAS